MPPAHICRPPISHFRGLRLRRVGGWAALCLLQLFAVSVAFAEPRLWTDLDGRRYDAEIYSVHDDSVTLRRTDGRTLTLGMEDLVATDQLAAREWLLQQPGKAGERPPPTQTLSPFGRPFLIDEPRVLRLRALVAQGYPRPYLGIPVTLRNKSAGKLEFVNVYFFDAQKARIPFSQPPPNSPIMVQDGGTSAIARPGEFKPGETNMVLFPLIDPALRTAPHIVIVAGNGLQAVATVYPEGSWRDYDFPERDRVVIDKYADYTGQELYTEKTPADLFEIVDVLRLLPLNGDHGPTRDFFRLVLRVIEPFPAAALSGRWYAFDKEHRLLYTEDLPPYAVRARKDGFYAPLLSGSGPAEIGDVVPRTKGQSFHFVQLPGAVWWDRPEVDSIVFTFGTETKKVARVFSKSGTALANLPLPEKESLGGARPTAEKEIPVRSY